MPSKKVDWKIAFDPVTGDHQPLPKIKYEYDKFGTSATAIEPEWRDQFSFEDSLRYVKYVKGKTSLGFIWRAESTGIHYTMHLAEMDRALPYVVGGCLSGTFVFVKSGESTGIRFQL